ncbi:MAG: hypothetical protein VZR54_02565 [Ruminococcus sp.]|nr:hypothetical protein [Ruminococcus sp.]
MNYYGNPANLTWNVSDSGLPTGCEIHLKGEYESATNVSDFAPYNVVFDLTKNPNTVYPNKKILTSYENVHSATFGGAHPYSIKLVDDNNMIWPITNGSRGFPTCVKHNNNYYMITDNSGVLKRVTIDSNNRASGTTSETLSGLSLKVSNEYIGNYTVKMIYTVKNTGSNDITFSMGSSGDIQIGTDDRAKIEDLKITGEGNTEKIIGITMTSGQDKDKVDGKYPTLGFVGKEVGGSAADAEYFYGAATMALNTSATATKADKLMPARIFEPLSGTSISSDGFSQNADSGLSFHWDDITLLPQEEKQYAVIFTVPYTEKAETEQQTSANIAEKVISEVESNIGKHEEDTYVTSNPERTIFFRNEQQVANDDTLAQLNGYSELQNFLLLGVQKKTEMTTRNCLRYVTVVNTNILRDADEYGYIIAKAPRTSENDYKNLRSKINKVTYGAKNTYKENVKASSNEISGNYGIYGADTPYKYVTMGINDVPDDKVLVVRFYVKKGDKFKYADYYTDLNNKIEANRYDGCSADWQAVVNAAVGH